MFSFSFSLVWLKSNSTAALAMACRLFRANSLSEPILMYQLDPYYEILYFI